jgi:hypothetical protein
MTFHTQQIQTDQGVLIGLPISEWEKLMKDYRKLKQKKALEKRIENSLREVKEIEEGKRQPMSLKDFFDAL